MHACCGYFSYFQFEVFLWFQIWMQKSLFSLLLNFQNWMCWLLMSEKMKRSYNDDDQEPNDDIDQLINRINFKILFFFVCIIDTWQTSCKWLDKNFRMRGKSTGSTHSTTLPSSEIFIVKSKWFYTILFSWRAICFHSTACIGTFNSTEQNTWVIEIKRIPRSL